MWQIEIYDVLTRKWVRYGKRTEDFEALNRMCIKMAENGQKARIVRC